MKRTLYAIFGAVFVLAGATGLFFAFFPADVYSWLKTVPGFVPVVSTDLNGPAAQVEAMSQSEGPGGFLRNAGLEGPGVAPTVDPSSKESASGSIAPYWSDDSSSQADISVQYSLDTSNPHGGSSSQMIVVQRVGSGSLDFAQSLNLPAGDYSGSVWLRAAKQTPVTLQLRDSAQQGQIYCSSKATIGTEWQRMSLSGSLPATASCLFMIQLDKPGTIWVDDAELHTLSLSIWIVSSIVLACLVMGTVAAVRLSRRKRTVAP